MENQVVNYKRGDLVTTGEYAGVVLKEYIAPTATEHGSYEVRFTGGTKTVAGCDLELMPQDTDY